MAVSGKVFPLLVADADDVHSVLLMIAAPLLVLYLKEAVKPLHLQNNLLLYSRLRKSLTVTSKTNVCSGLFQRTGLYSWFVLSEFAKCLENDVASHCINYLELLNEVCSPMQYLSLTQRSTIPS